MFCYWLHQPGCIRGTRRHGYTQQLIGRAVCIEAGQRIGYTKRIRLVQIPPSGVPFRQLAAICAVLCGICPPAVPVSEHSGDRCHAAALDRESDWRDNRVLLLRSVHGKLSECAVKVFPDEEVLPANPKICLSVYLSNYLKNRIYPIYWTQNAIY